MSVVRHKQIYQSDLLVKTRGDAESGSAPCLIVLMSLRPAIPWQVGLHQSPPPLYQPISMLHPPAETVNHHLTGAGEFSTGKMGNFQPELTDASSQKIHETNLKNRFTRRIESVSTQALD